jgi:hypothetical protein
LVSLSPGSLRQWADDARSVRGSPLPVKRPLARYPPRKR